MAYSAIERLLKQHMGLHSATVGSGMVAQAVEERMLACDISDPQDYLQVILHAGTELDALIDTVIVPETWFYRDQYPFEAFIQWVSHHWLAKNPVSPLRVLSVPCSTGEEPYTLAMCLADLGISANSAQIDAVDISHDNIAKAVTARYGRNSFRSQDLAFRDRHFVADGERYRLAESIRKRVNFVRANILDEAFLQRQPYDVIFCRNLLIYFDRPTQNRSIGRLDELLTPGGILFLGHSETSLLLERNFTALDYPRCFGFKRRQVEVQAEAEADARPARPAKPATRRRSDNTREKPSRPFAGVVHAVPPTQEAATATGRGNGTTEKDNTRDGDSLLDDAFRLADQGHLDEAALRCETLLRKNSHQVEALYLLGLVREAAGSIEDAAQMFRKTIYLDPDHYEALAHLGVICQQQGDAVSAERFQQRAARAQLRSRAEEKHR